MLYQKLNNRTFNITFSFFCFILLILTSCSSARKQLKKENFENAISLSINKLYKDQNDAKHKAILREAAMCLYQETETRKANLDYSNEKHIKRALSINESLLYTLEDGVEYVKEIDGYVIFIKEDNIKLQRLLAKLLYEHGRELIRTAALYNDKLIFLKAHEILEESSKYAINDSILYYKELALQKGHMYIYVETDNRDIMSSTFDVDRNFSNIENFSNKKWTYFYQRSLDKKEADINIEIILYPMVSSQSVTQDTDEYSENIKTGETVCVDTSGIETRTPIYTEVFGYVYTHRDHLHFEWPVEVIVESPRNYVETLRFRNSEKRTSTIETITTGGDQRAIPSMVFCGTSGSFPSEYRVRDQLIDNHADFICSLGLDFAY